MPDILITPDDLADLIAAGRRVRVLDVRWRLDRPDGRPEYLAGHVPGAVFVDLDRELASHGAPTDGRHPLPDVSDLQAAARRWGIDEGDTVVVFDGLASLSAARAWWVLTDAGIADVRILDGALSAWSRAGHPLEAGDVVPDPGAVVLSAGHLPQVTIDEAAALAASGALLDVRAPERYRGDVEPMDPRAGHIPGSLNLPTAGNVGEDGRFLAPEALRRRFEQVGVDDVSPVALSCGSGVSAAHAFVAMRLAGLQPQLYAGSWSQWSNHPDRPVATGPHPDGSAGD